MSLWLRLLEFVCDGDENDEGLLFGCMPGSVCGRDFAGLVFGLRNTAK